MTAPAIKIGLIGMGRLGALIFNTINDRSDCIVAAILKPRSKPLATLPYVDTIDATFAVSDVVIDVSSPELFDDVIAAARAHKTALVSGTTGLKNHHHDAMRAAADEIPVFYATNFSMGVALVNRAVAMLAASVDESFDVEISESHHRNKVDAPSGTALTLGRTVAMMRGHDFGTVACFDRSQRNITRPAGEIGFAVTRGGNVFGEHTVHFISNDEKIDVGHMAFSRECFAKGAIKAALWVIEQKPGPYGMDALIGTKG